MGKAKELATAIESLTGSPLKDEELSEYLVAVESLFTAPFLARDVLVETLTKHWPGDAQENMVGLVAAGLIELTPSGRYRLPLPAWAPATPDTERTILPTPAPAPMRVVRDAPLPTAAAEVSLKVQGNALPAPIKPKLKPLRLAITPITA